jgi:hypothetical protein
MSRLQIFPLLLQLDPIRPNGPSYHLRNLCPLTALVLILLISPFSFASSRNQRIIGPRRKSLLALPSRRNRCATAAGTGNSRKCIGHLGSARNRNASALRKREQKRVPHDHLSPGLSQTYRGEVGPSCPAIARIHAASSLAPSVLSFCPGNPMSSVSMAPRPAARC